MLNKLPFVPLILCVVIFLAGTVPTRAQTDDEVTKATATAFILFKQEQYAEAVPHLEIVIKANPSHSELRFMYGWSLLAKSKQVSNTTEAKVLSDKALEQFREAKKLGFKDQANDALIALLSGEASSGNSPQFSSNPEAEKFMVEAESLFARSKYDEALVLFEKALAADPKLYMAATSGGDSYIAKGDWENAEKWYQKAIAIDPNRETAYRYSATPFMRQKKYDQARDRYIEAFIVEPYSQMSLRGINQWAQVTGKSLGHPEVGVPELTFDSTGKATAKKPVNAADTSTAPWLAYIAVRENWKKEKFRQTFPKEREYRHTLVEEAESLRAALKAAQAQERSSKEFEMLGRMDKDGVLESFILLAYPDDGIAADHEEYLKNNRAKLRQYVANYVIKK